MEKQWTLCCRDSQESSMVGHKLIAPNWKTRSVTFHLEISPSISHLLISTPKNDLVFSKLHLLKVSISRRIKVFGHSTLRGVRTRLRAWTPPISQIPPNYFNLFPLSLLPVSVYFWVFNWSRRGELYRGEGTEPGDRKAWERTNTLCPCYSAVGEDHLHDLLPRQLWDRSLIERRHPLHLSGQLKSGGQWQGERRSWVLRVAFQLGFWKAKEIGERGEIDH